MLKYQNSNTDKMKQTSILKKLSPLFQEDADVIKFEKLNLKKIKANQVWQVEQLIGFDALIVDGSNVDYAKYFINMMRAHHNPDYYLKPLFIFKPHPAIDTDLKFLYDGEYKTDNDLPEMGQKTWDIFLRTTELEDILSLPYEAQIIKRVMNYFHTRNITSIYPTRSTSSTFGFVYPMISAILKGEEEYKVIDILEWAAEEGLLAGEFYERIYLCNNCSGGFLSFREVCPNCHSSDSITQDLVHHFPCAYVGPIADFSANQNNELTCPKCNKNLRHIGVDYDKPSVIHHCNQCKADFQDLFVQAKCICCGTDNEVQYLVPKKLKKYEIMKKGKLAAISGILSSESQKPIIDGSLRLDVFKIMLKHELEKVKYYNESKLLLAGISILNLFDLRQRLGRHSHETLSKEIMREVKNSLNPIDLICMDQDDTIYISMLHTDLKRANEILEKISAVLSSLINDNFNQFKADIKIASLEIPVGVEIDTQIDLLKSMLA